MSTTTETIATTGPSAAEATSGIEPTRTLPPAAYTDAQLYEDELRDVFERGWALIGHVSEVAEPGQYLTATIGREPVAVIRGTDGELRALSNVCRHRGAVILDGGGTCRKVMRCPYHAWTYRLDGSLAAAPSGRGFKRFDRDSVALPQLSIAELGGLVFASPNPEPMPLRELLGPVAPFIESLNLARLRVHRWPTEGRSRRLTWRGLEPATKSRFEEEFGENWKIMADNYLEDYHTPVAHPGLVRLLDVKETVGDGNAWSEWSRVPMRTRPSRVPRERLYQRLARRMPSMPEAFEGAWGNMHIWPGTFFEIYPHHVDTWQLEPFGLTGTRARTLCLVDPDAGPRDRLARRLLHQIQGDVMAEDVEITNRVQRGVEAPSFRAGVLNDAQESSVVRFQDRLRETLPRIRELERAEQAR